MEAGFGILYSDAKPTFPGLSSAGSRAVLSFLAYKGQLFFAALRARNHFLLGSSHLILARIAAGFSVSLAETDRKYQTAAFADFIYFLWIFSPDFPAKAKRADLRATLA
jgi:hypothetical protein